MRPPIVEALQRSLGPDKVRTDAETRASRRHDYWMASQLDDLGETPAPSPCCVAMPREVSDVVTVVNACRETETPLVPYGLGSGVCGGIVTSEHSVVLDLGALCRVRQIDTTNLLASFDAGVRGSDAEAAATARGMTLGHYPQSIAVSSVGGWVATRAAGQFSTGYGNIEDILFGLEAVLPDGSVLQTRATPRSSAGPDLRNFLLGSEGTLGVITGVTLSARRLPEHRVGAAFYLRDMPAGFELQREIIQRGWQVAAMRQYDPVESERMFAGHSRDGTGLLVLVHEGPRARVEAEVSAVRGIAQELGCEPASDESALHWLDHRNHVPSFEAFIKNGVVVDTIEVAGTWDTIPRIYAGAVEALRTVPGLLAGSAHSSHVYRSGLNLYFTFVAQPANRDLRGTYMECWRRVMEATVGAGGGIAHHHGIGRVRKAWLEDELGSAGIAMLRALKQALDPAGFMNPGALLPEDA